VAANWLLSWKIEPTPIRISVTRFLLAHRLSKGEQFYQKGMTGPGDPKGEQTQIDTGIIRLQLRKGNACLGGRLPLN